MQSAQRELNRIDSVTATVQAALSPIGRTAGNTAQWMGDFSYGLLYARDLTIQNRRLKQQAVAAALYLEQLDRLERQIDALRRLQGLPQIPGRTRMPADIVGFFPRDNRLTLSLGSKDGIKSGMAVVSADGLVGVVQTVDATRCQALLITSASIRLGGMDISRNPPPIGLFTGINASTLELTLYDPKAPVQIGDVIVTSGYGERIPGGIVIGKVIQVDDDEEFGTRKAMIDPSVSMGQVREVQILK